MGIRAVGIRCSREVRTWTPPVLHGNTAAGWRSTVHFYGKVLAVMTPEAVVQNVRCWRR